MESKTASPAATRPRVQRVGWTYWRGTNSPTKAEASECIRGFSTATKGALERAIETKTLAADSRASRLLGSLCRRLHKYTMEL
eukprot:scaffold67465_cov37-Tisochrysis_lutea.AAC.1